ncbi:MAG: HEPN domain-containing protein, partial [Candidatus Bipolaricaulota bacterium]|nr:HEPN domain-containing protein [Candidatus Bipolaricaulota bacterium]
MASRARDWMSQAERDLSHAREAQGVGHHEWACFAAHQAAEKAIQVLFQSLGADARGHSVVGLLEELPPSLRPAAELWDAAGRLDRHYIPTRYPNAFPSGA